MGKRYYAGVPGMNEQFGPVAASMVKRGLTSTRRSSSPSWLALTIVFLIGLPVLPFWSGIMFILEMFSNLRLEPGTEEYSQNLYNLKFSGILFMISVVPFTMFFRSIM